MSVTVREFTSALEAVAPPALAEPWDSVGLQVGDPDAPLATVMLAVDATLSLVTQAVAAHCRLLVVHHPLLFAPLRAVTARDPVSDVVAELIRQGVALYAAHTNLDVAPRVGTAAALAAALGLQEPRVLRAGCAGAGGFGGEPTGAGRLGRVAAMPLATLAATVGATLGREAVSLHGDPTRLVTSVAAMPGSGGDGLAEAASVGAEVIVTGELKHHELLEAGQRGVAVILAGHLHTERPVLPALQKHLQPLFPGVRVQIANESWPETHVHC